MTFLPYTNLELQGEGEVYRPTRSWAAADLCHMGERCRTRGTAYRRTRVDTENIGTGMTAGSGCHYLQSQESNERIFDLLEHFR